MNDNNSRRQDGTRSHQPYSDLSHIQGSAIRGPGVSESSNGNGSGAEESRTRCAGTGSDDDRDERISLVKDFMSSLLDLKPKLTKAQRRKQLAQSKIRRDRKRRVNRLSAQRKRVREKGTLESLTQKNSILLGEKEALKREKSKIALLTQDLTELKAKLAQTREEKIETLSTQENPLEELTKELEAVEESRQEVLHRISLTQSQRQTQMASNDETSEDCVIRDACESSQDLCSSTVSASTGQNPARKTNDGILQGYHTLTRGPAQELGISNGGARVPHPSTTTAASCVASLLAALVPGTLSAETPGSTTVNGPDNQIRQSLPVGRNSQLLEQLQGLLLSAQAPTAAPVSSRVDGVQSLLESMRQITHAVSTAPTPVQPAQDPLQALLSAFRAS